MTIENPTERLLVELTAAIGPADWTRFKMLVTSANEGGTPRRQLEETLLQATLFFGFPRAVSAFECLTEAWPTDSPIEPDAIGESKRRDAGVALFDAIYRERSEQVRAKLRSFHPEFHDFVLESAYGRILARRGLEPRVRELCAVAALTVLDQIPQLVAHGRGALALGATERDVEAAIRIGLPDIDAAALLRRITARR